MARVTKDNERKDDAWRSRVVGAGEEAPERLLPNPANWRVHPALQQQAMGAVLDEVGWVQQVIVNRTTGHLVDGHLRVSLALSRHEARVPVVYVELTPEEEALVLASFDPISAMAIPDQEKIRALLSGLAVKDDALLAMLENIAPVDAPTPWLTDPDDLAEPPGEPITRPGDLWLLGEHRILCADARKAGAWARLMQGMKADMVFTDPPYGLAYVGKTARRLTIAGDRPDEAALGELLGAALAHAWQACRPGACWYVSAPAGPSLDVFAAALRELGVRRHTLVWVKDAFVLGRADYHYRHETLFYGWKEGAHHPPPERSQDSVWEIPRPRKSAEHPTMKPVELIARALRNSTEPGEVILDPFAGSGTSLIAAETTGRIARVIEIDPSYCDVIIARFEAFTGAKAVLA
ncbi:MAG: DNA modification methylase [Actinobacteria bacterium]|nr:DNA modification methylase [Actinomycetota bacterium]